MSLNPTPGADIQAKPRLGPHPLVVGITGHRDLVPEDIPSLRRTLETVLADFRSRHPDTPLVLLSGLAEGADRLAAEVGLQSGASHVAILPRPVEAYLQDFTTDESRREFQRLLQRSSSVVVAQPDQGIQGYTEQAIEIIRRSSVVVAAWDGKDDQSGTAQAVRLSLDGSKTGGPRPVWWIRTRRAREPGERVSLTIQVLGNLGNGGTRV